MSIIPCSLCESQIDLEVEFCSHCGYTLNVSHLGRTLRDKDFHHRIRAAHLLGRMGKKEALPNLIDTLKDTNSDVQGAAVTALVQIGREQNIQSEMLTALKSEHWDIRFGIIWVLGEIGNLQAIEKLGKLGVRDSNVDVRNSALEAMEKIISKQRVKERNPSGVIISYFLSFLFFNVGLIMGSLAWFRLNVIKLNEIAVFLIKGAAPLLVVIGLVGIYRSRRKAQKRIFEGIKLKILDLRLDGKLKKEGSLFIGRLLMEHANVGNLLIFLAWGHYLLFGVLLTGIGGFKRFWWLSIISLLLLPRLISYLVLYQNPGKKCYEVAIREFY